MNRKKKLVEMLAVLCARGKLVEIAPSRYLTSSTLDRLWTDCETMLTKYHREHPLHAGMRLAGRDSGFCAAKHGKMRTRSSPALRARENSR